jgi:hypothetical protein
LTKDDVLKIQSLTEKVKTLSKAKKTLSTQICFVLGVQAELLLGVR